MRSWMSRTMSATGGRRRAGSVRRRPRRARGAAPGMWSRRGWIRRGCTRSTGERATVGRGRRRGGARRVALALRARGDSGGSLVGRGGLYREILRVPDARALIGASAVSQLGDWLYNAVLLGYVYAATGSAGWVGAATVFRLLPYVLLIPVGGMLADRYDKRTVLLLGDTVRCVLMLGLAVVVGWEGPVVLVIALTMLSTAAGSGERPAAMALLPRLVGESRLGPANALLHTVQEIGVV